MTFIAGLKASTPTYFFIMRVLSAQLLGVIKKGNPQCYLKKYTDQFTLLTTVHSSIITHTAVHMHIQENRALTVHIMHIMHSLCSSHAEQLAAVLPQLQWNCQVITSTTHAHPSYIALISKGAAFSFVLPGGVLFLHIHVRCIFRIVVRNSGCCVGGCVELL